MRTPKTRPKAKTIYIVKLPDHECREDNTIVEHLAWGEISPNDWHRYTRYAEKATDAFCKSCATKWVSLRVENAPLRAMLNGQLHSVSESICNYFIYREIEKQQNEFQETMLIRTVLGKYQLGIGDAWVANRIEKMIADGKLSPSSELAKGYPLHRRELRKIK